MKKTIIFGTIIILLLAILVMADELPRTQIVKEHCNSKLGMIEIEGQCTFPKCSKDSDCDRGIECETYSCVDAGTVDADCLYALNTDEFEEDGCCPATGASFNDADCTPDKTEFRPDCISDDGVCQNECGWRWDSDCTPPEVDSGAVAVVLVN